MPTSLQNLDPIALAVVAGAALWILLMIAYVIVRRRKSAAADARRRAELRQHYDVAQGRQQEVERLAQRIIATSSRASIAGFVLVRQIEAVFTDGHPTPAKAVEVLKALAAEKGANALINLDGQRLPSGKCTARGDAVIVRPVGVRPKSPAGEEEPAR